ncbi:MAG: class I SAM-dependent methyltransferase [Alphaproteobacteria bacterium]|nr:class I SAM-dependent methyltransferase [Alphaproteobacteria bacterium]
MMSTSSSREEWAARAALWDKHAPEGESVTDELNQILIEITGTESGDNVLDLASGSGEPAISIALKVGAKGSVTALDAHGEMLAVTRRRAAKLELSNMAFEIARMEDLPFADDTFDAVTCRFGLQSSEDAVQTLREARRVLKPAGKAGFMTHGVEERNTLSAVLANVIRSTLPEKSGETPPRRLRFRDAGSLRVVFDAAGFSEVGEREVLRTVIREGGSQFWRSLLERRYGSRLKALDAEGRSQLDAAIDEAFAVYLAGDHYELQSADMVAWGTK